MAVEIFLITDPETDADHTVSQLQATLGQTSASALLVAAGGDEDAAYVERVKALATIAQQHDCAVLVDNRPDLVQATGADGVHMSGGIGALRAAIETLKPHYIVGTGDIGSRHEAMLRGELDLDYLMFGDRDAPEADRREMAQWWAETFEVSAVYRAHGDETGPLEALGTEFIAFSQGDWNRILQMLGERP